MRRGSIAVSDLGCDGCGRNIRHSERYLLTDEESSAKGKGGKTLRYCVDCCLSKGYAHYKQVEKGKQVLTFFTAETDS